MERMDSQSSLGSSLQGDGSEHSVGPALAGQDADERADLLKGEAGLQNALFELLYSLSKVKLGTSSSFVLLAIALEYLQLEGLIFAPHFPWNFDHGFWAYRVFERTQLQRLAMAGGMIAFIVFFFLVVMTVFAVQVLGVCCAMSIRTNRSAEALGWHVRVLKAPLAILWGLFYPSLLGFSVSGLNCRLINVSPKPWVYFPQETCFSMPHLVILIAALPTAGLTIATAFLLVVAAQELDPASTCLGAMAHASASFRWAIMKTLLIVLAHLMSRYHIFQGVMFTGLTASMLYVAVQDVVYLTSWVNYLQAGLYSMLTWSSLVLFIMALTQSSHLSAELSTYVVLGGLPFAFAAGALGAHGRMLYAHKTAQRFHNAKASNLLRVRHRFWDAQEVEVTARCARKQDQDRDYIPAWVAAAEAAYLEGKQQMPKSAYLHLRLACFLAAFKPVSKGAFSAELALARKCSPSLPERYALFVMSSKHGSKSVASTDLVSAGELQHYYQGLTQKHMEALVAIRAFWREVLSSKASVASLAKAFTIVDHTETQAEDTYRLVLERYGTNPKVLRAYAHFLQEVKCDPWKAQRYLEQADKQDILQTEDQKTAAIQATFAGADGGDGTLLAADIRGAVVICSDEGVITYSNQALSDMLGYKPNALNGSSISVLIPGPANFQHPGYMQSYKQTHRATKVDKSAQETVALSADGYGVPVRLEVTTNIGGEGLTGVFEEVEEDPNTGLLWLSRDGHIFCCSQGLHHLLGHTPSDVEGSSLQSLGGQDLERQLTRALDSITTPSGTASAATTTAAAAPEPTAAGLTGPRPAPPAGAEACSFQASLRHRYGIKVPVTVSLASSLMDKQGSVLCCTISVSPEQAKIGMVVADSRGRIVYANSAFSTTLHVPLVHLMGGSKKLSDFMPEPHRAMHEKWRAAAIRTKAQPGKLSCRTGRVVAMLGGRHRQPSFVTMDTQINEGPAGQQFLLAQMRPWQGQLREEWGIKTEAEAMASTKRLRLLVSCNGGQVLAACGDVNHAKRNFGVNPQDLANSHINDCLDFFAAAATLDSDAHSGPAGNDDSQAGNGTADLLKAMLLHTSIVSGTTLGPASFAMGFQHVAQDSTFCTMQARTRVHVDALSPDVAGVELFDLRDMGTISQDMLGSPADMDGSALACLDLWAADLLEAILEVDSSGAIKSSNHDATALFGMTPQAITKANIRNLLQLPGDMARSSAMNLADMLGLAHPTAMKAVAKPGPGELVSEKQAATGLHADGSKVQCSLQGMDKHGDSLRYVLRITTQGKAKVPLNPQRIVSSLLRARPVAQSASGNLALTAVEADPSAADNPALDENEEGAADEDKAASEAAQSEQSSVDARSDAQSKQSEDVGHEEQRQAFARAKRFKKLTAAMKAPAATRHLTILWRATVVLLLAVAVTHTSCFFGDRTIYNKISSKTMTAYQLISGAIRIHAMDEAAQNLYGAMDSTSPPSWNTYSPAWISSYVTAQQATLHMATQDYGNVLQTAFTQSQPGSDIWSFMVSGTSADFYVQAFANTTPPHQYWQRTGLEIATTKLVQYCLSISNMGSDELQQLHQRFEWHYPEDNIQSVLGWALDEFRDMETASATAANGSATKLLLVLMVIYGLVIMPAITAGLWFQLERVRAVRKRTFQAFLLLPRPTVTALAQKQVDLGDDFDEAAEHPAQQQADQQAEDQDAALKFTQSGRQLQKGSIWDTHYLLLLPFALWAVVIIVLISTSYTAMQGNQGRVTGCLLCRSLNVNQARIRAAAMRLQLAPNAQAAASAQATILSTVSTLNMLLNGLQFGNTSLDLPRSTSMISDTTLLNTLIKPGCMRTNQTSCLTPSSPYYAVSISGLRGMLSSFISSAEMLANAAYPLSINDTNLQLIKQIGAFDMYGGLLTLCGSWFDEAVHVLNSKKTLEVVVLVILLCAIPVFFLAVLQPFCKQLAKESHRMADLMSQLPTTMDVVGLVNRALLTQEPMTSDRTGQGLFNTADEGGLPPKEESADESASAAGFKPAAESEPVQIIALEAEDDPSLKRAGSSQPLLGAEVQSVPGLTGPKRKSNFKFAA